MKGFITLIVLFFVLVGCIRENFEAGFIDPVFVDYVDRFVEEGHRQGVDIDISDLTVRFAKGSAAGDNQGLFCGQAPNYMTQSHPLVHINRSCWEAYNDVERELLLFHELGHAVLKRSHFRRKIPGGFYASIMVSGGHLLKLYDTFTLLKRDYYMQELFRQEVPLPHWARYKTKRELFWEASFDEAITDQWSFSTSSGHPTSHTGRVTPGKTGGSYSLQISNRDAGATQAAFWSHTIHQPDFPVGDQLILTVRLRLEEVRGNGITLALHGKSHSEMESPFYLTTEEIFSLYGTTADPNREYSLATLRFFPEKVDEIAILLLMEPNTTGTVFFDAVRLERRY